MSGRPLHVHFVNENIGGHATLHAHLRAALAARPEIEATHFDVPPRRGLERLVGAAVPGLARLDLDFQPLRAQLARSAIVRRHLSELEHLPDALHIYTQNAALLSIEHLRRVPTVVSTDATNRQNARLIPARRPTVFTGATVAATVPFERRVYAEARRLVAHSTWAADSIANYGVARAKIEVIPFGIAVCEELQRAPRNGPPRILFVGRSMERKGGWRLLRTWQSRLAATSRLTLVTLEPVAAPAGVEVRNDVRPGDGKLERILAESDVFALPTELDTFGYAILEAMAAGLPVVAPRRAAIPELVDDGVTGLLFPPDDDEAFARALETLVTDGEARRQLGDAGRRRVEERFDAQRTTAQLIDVIRDVSA